jgi:CDGSH-type Zn-finger protein
MTDATIKVNDNGPYLITGTHTVTDAEGNALQTKETTFLCRCGHSANKPFCDGSHKREGFESQVRAQ